MLAGWTVPTQRSFLMSGLVLTALIIDRSAISMRVVAWSAMVVLAFMPEALLNPSFQMSYAAVIALIAGYEVAQPTITRWRAPGGWWRFVVVYVGRPGVLVAARDPGRRRRSPPSPSTGSRCSAWPANMIAVPLSGVLVMPAGLIGVLLMPFGWEAVGLVPMGWGIALINDVGGRDRGLAVGGHQGAGLPDRRFGRDRAGRAVDLPVARQLALVGARAWSPRDAWRRCWPGPPDLLISADGRLMAINPRSGHLMLSSLTGERFTADAWMARFAEDQPADLAAPSSAAGADGTGRAARIAMRPLRLPLSHRAACRRARDRRAGAGGRLPHRDDPDQRGAGARTLRIAHGRDRPLRSVARRRACLDPVRRRAWTVESVRDYRGVRPWARAPEARRRAQSP